MGKRPFFSIIVPAYNEEETIGATLESLKGQSFKDFEIIVVNNNSTDKTGQIAKKLVKTVLFEKRQGYIYTVQRGARKARGAYLTFADADSIYQKDWLQKFVKCINSSPDAGGIYGSARFYDNNPIINFLSGIIYSSFLHISHIMGHFNPAGFNFVVKKKAYFDAGGYDPKIYNNISPDVELGNRIAKKWKLILDTSNVVHTSSRRFNKNNLIKTTWMFFNAWVSLHFGKKQKIDYEQYNRERR